MTTTLSLPVGCRYKDTRVYIDPDKVTSFALMEAPPELVASVDDIIHEVTQNEVGFLDKLAATYYGFGYEHLWWVIALVNGVIDPEGELAPGTRLRVPPRATVMNFLMRAGYGGN